MKLPSYLRSRRRPDLDTPTSVGFEFFIDTDGFRGRMHKAAEEAREIEYRGRLASEAMRGRAYVGQLLDRLCLDLGWDPDVAWRQPRAREEQDRRDRAIIRVRQRAAGMVGDAIWAGIRREHPFVGGGA